MSKKITWLDWVDPLPPEQAVLQASPLLTREELLAALERENIKATARNIIFWQRRGILPFPTKRRSNKTTVATYPSWMPRIVARLREEQEQGKALDECAEELRLFVAAEYGVTGMGDQLVAKFREAQRVAQLNDIRRAIRELQGQLAYLEADAE